MINFRKKYSIHQRLDESRRILAKYPDRIPVIITKNNKNDLPKLDKFKYLVPKISQWVNFHMLLENV